MRYAVVIEKAEGNYSAYVPDLPGCVATGETVAAVESEIRQAIRFQIEGFMPMASRSLGRPALPNTSKRKRPGSASISLLKFERCAERLGETCLR